jgi:hypothetical protein
MTSTTKAGAMKILGETAEARRLAEARGGAPWRRFQVEPGMIDVHQDLSLFHAAEAIGAWLVRRSAVGGHL